jgi:hypothetical protein
MATMATTAICRCTFSRGSVCCGCLRPWNIDASAGSREEVERIVTQIRARWPEVRIILRVDSGFCRNALMRANQIHCIRAGPESETASTHWHGRGPSAFVTRANAARPPACSPEFAEQSRSPRETTGQCSTWNMPGISETGSNAKAPKKAADRIDFSLGPI